MDVIMYMVCYCGTFYRTLSFTFVCFILHVRVCVYLSWTSVLCIEMSGLKLTTRYDGEMNYDERWSGNSLKCDNGLQDEDNTRESFSEEI